MNQPKQPNGWDLAVDGMNTAASHADRVVPDWSKEATIPNGADEQTIRDVVEEHAIWIANGAPKR